MKVIFLSSVRLLKLNQKHTKILNLLFFYFFDASIFLLSIVSFILLIALSVMSLLSSFSCLPFSYNALLLFWFFEFNLSTFHWMAFWFCFGVFLRYRQRIFMIWKKNCSPKTLKFDVFFSDLPVDNFRLWHLWTWKIFITNFQHYCCSMGLKKGKLLKTFKVRGLFVKIVWFSQNLMFFKNSIKVENLL